ncbi:Rpn family recombination-promoting nuclease/putative transposase [Microcoleus sp. BROC3]|uniref:Rpn family recombination-promoting nuclease/putative transposase n=1 Tax=Microcoleus sp. BROC3 TaxID=3055323 RepID=UPI002FD3A7B4
MRFISPKTDFAFKRIFGSSEHPEILISFLNAMLYNGEPTIQELEIIDPYSAGSVTGLKDTYLDVKAKITGNKTVIVEMQVLNVAAFEKRVVYNAAKTYSTQLKAGEGYLKLNPVIALTITDFILFENTTKLISNFEFTETEEKFVYPNCELKLVFVELPKFKKELNELETLPEKWIYFMKNAPSLEAVPETLGSIEEINTALGIANRANLTLDELNDVDKREMFIQDQIGSVMKGIEIGLQQGIEQGIQQGIEQGIQQGIERGKVEGEIGLIIRQIVRRVGDVTVEVQTRIQGLSAEQLDDLGEALLDFRSQEDLIAWLESAAG